MLLKPATEAEYKSYLAWKAAEGIPPVKNTQEAVTVLKGLQTFLAKYNIKLTVNVDSLDLEQGGVNRLARQLLESVPESYWKTGKVKEIVLGATRGSAALTSEWVTEEGSVHIFKYVLDGPKRLFSALLLHETGHGAAEVIEDLPNYNEIIEAYKILKLDEGKNIYSTEFGLGDRRDYQSGSNDPSEFLAETFMVYITQGAALRAHINSIPDPAARDAYQKVYETYKKLLGVEYSELKPVESKSPQLKITGQLVNSEASAYSQLPSVGDKVSIMGSDGTQDTVRVLSYIGGLVTLESLNNGKTFQYELSLFEKNMLSKKSKVTDGELSNVSGRGEYESEIVNAHKPAIFAAGAAIAILIIGGLFLFKHPKPPKNSDKKTEIELARLSAKIEEFRKMTEELKK